MNEYGRPSGMPYGGEMRYGSINTGRGGQQDMQRESFRGQNPNAAGGGYRPQRMNTGAAAPRGDPPCTEQSPPLDRGASAPSISSLLGNIRLDEEKIVIIFLIVILARSGADFPLLAALGYLLM